MTTSAHLYDPAAAGAADMPMHERALLDMFADPAGGIGLAFDGAGVPLMAWLAGPAGTVSVLDSHAGRVVDRHDIGASVVTAAERQDTDHLAESPTDPFEWLFADVPRDRGWDDRRTPVYEIAPDGLDDLRRDGDGLLRTGADIAAHLLASAPRSFFALSDGNQFHLLAHTDDGDWEVSGCGPYIVWFGDYPSKDGSDRDGRVSDFGYDTPFVDGLGQLSHPAENETRQALLSRIRRVDRVSDMPHA
jgi:hypothetical protein